MGRLVHLLNRLDIAQEAGARIIADLSAQKTRPPWWGGDLQTLRHSLTRQVYDLAPWPVATRTLRFADNGDGTTAHVHHAPAGAPALIIVHGLGGDGEGDGVMAMARAACQAGWAAIRINLRGAPSVYHLASGLSHAGKADDLAAIITQLAPDLDGRRVFIAAFSLGGNLLLRGLGTGVFDDLRIDAAMSICAPLDLKATQLKVMQPRNWLYARYLLAGLKAAALNIEIAEDWKAAARSATSVFEFDDKVTAPFHGFDGANDYYGKVSCGAVLRHIKIPTLLLHSANDPWISADDYRACQRELPPNVAMVIARTGGHVGFHMRGQALPAYCQAALTWFTACRDARQQ